MCGRARRRRLKELGGDRKMSEEFLDKNDTFLGCYMGSRFREEFLVRNMSPSERTTGRVRRLLTDDLVDKNTHRSCLRVGQPLLMPVQCTVDIDHPELTYHDPRDWAATIECCFALLSSPRGCQRFYPGTFRKRKCK
ncbi:hypothetical protein RRG08_049474 [Elysia crispata]|uniref:Uncharacterized protein n=1 Tax=Elysia crispata TaxID=231223 RepID=A0AAE1DM72_9GAST|nr:hypothetical protein RRG08_049474 [Elysia crispata]